MHGKAKLLALVPNPTQDAIGSVEALKRHYSCGIDVVIPSTLDGIDLTALRELRATTEQIFTFSTTPVEMLERHQEVAIRAAVLYELGRVAIPVHYQNVRDQLQREYGFASVRDSQVERILSESSEIAMVRDHVYKTKHRYRDPEIRTLLRHWSVLIASNFCDGVYDLPSYCVQVGRWFDKMASVPCNDFPSIVSPIYLQLNAGDSVVFVKSSEGRSTARILFTSGLECFAGGLLSDLISGFVTPLDPDILEQVSKADDVRKALESAPLGRAAVEALQKYAHLWMDYIRNQNLRGQEQKWRGWYLVPEHGPLTIGKLWELQRILVRLHELSSGGSLLIDTSDIGVANVLALLKAGGVTYQQSYSGARRRALFIRQQKNYLVRLGLVMEPANSYISVTDLGMSWLSIRTEHGLRSAFKAIMEEIRWTWCNMPFFHFTRELARRSEGFILYRELFNWVIHAYDHSQLEELVLALRTSRQLPAHQRNALGGYIERKLKSLLEHHISESAFGHYRGKIRDLMEAFATTGDFVIKGDGDATKLVLSDRSRQ